MNSVHAVELLQKLGGTLTKATQGFSWVCVSATSLDDLESNIKHGSFRFMQPSIYQDGNKEFISVLINKNACVKPKSVFNMENAVLQYARQFFNAQRLPNIKDPDIVLSGSLIEVKEKVYKLSRSWSLNQYVKRSLLCSVSEKAGKVVVHLKLQKGWVKY